MIWVFLQNWFLSQEEISIQRLQSRVVSCMNSTRPRISNLRGTFSLLHILSGDILNYSIKTKSTKPNQASPTYRANSKNYFHRKIILNTFDSLFFFF